MKIKFVLFVALILSVAFSSCGKKAEKAADYNNSIIVRQMRVIEALDLMDSTLRDSGATDQRMDYAFANLQATVKSAVMSVDSIGSFKNDPSLQIAARDLFRAYEAMTDGDYARLVSIRNLPQTAITQAVVDSNNAIIERIHLSSEEAQKRFIKAQEDFGKKYNLTFE